MRLFIAINFEDAIKGKLLSIQERLRKYSVKGNFTHRENLHLTVVFIGEVPVKEIDIIKKSMDAAAAVQAFDLQLNGLGRFKRDRGDIWWVGVEAGDRLLELQRLIAEKLINSGFIIDNRPFSPHLTIAREVVLDNACHKADFKAPLLNVTVTKFSLMKSERIAGKLVYTEVYAKDLINRDAK